MIGRGLDEKNLRKKIKQPLPDNLITIGELPHKDTLDAISACSTLVMTSKREGFPTVLLEAMALSKAVVAPKIQACEELIDSGKNGYLYSPDSIDDLIEKMNDAISSKKVGEKAKKRVENEFDWKIVIKKIDAIYEKAR